LYDRYDRNAKPKTTMNSILNPILGRDARQYMVSTEEVLLSVLELGRVESFDSIAKERAV
jgi:hypothetical protein